MKTLSFRKNRHGHVEERGVDQGNLIDALRMDSQSKRRAVFRRMLRSAVATTVVLGVVVAAPIIVKAEPSRAATQDQLAIAGTVAIGNTVTLNVSGMTPNGTWTLYGNSGITLTQPHSLSSTGSGSLSYDLTTSSPIESEINQYGTSAFIYAKDSSGATTSDVNVSNVSTSPSPTPSPSPSPTQSVSSNPNLSVSGTLAIGDTVTLNVSGLTPNGSWILYDKKGQLTQSHPINSAGSGSLVYNITSASPLAGVINSGSSDYIYAKDSSGLTTPYTSVYNVQTTKSPTMPLQLIEAGGVAFTMLETVDPTFIESLAAASEVDSCSQYIPVGEMVNIAKIGTAGFTVYRDNTTLYLGPTTAFMDGQNISKSSFSVSVGPSAGIELAIPCYFYTSAQVSGGQVSATISSTNFNITGGVAQADLQVVTAANPSNVYGFNVGASILSTSIGTNGTSLNIGQVGTSATINGNTIGFGTVAYQDSSNQRTAYITTSNPAPFPASGIGSSPSNPYQPNADRIITWQSAGWYDLTNVQANGGNPSGAYYVSNPAFISNYNAIIATETTVVNPQEQASGSGWGSSSGTGSLTLTGTGFTPNGAVEIISSAGNYTIGEYGNTQGQVVSGTANASGDYTITIPQQTEEVFLRGLGLPVSPGISVSIQLEAEDVTTGKTSNLINTGFVGYDGEP